MHQALIFLSFWHEIEIQIHNSHDRHIIIFFFVYDRKHCLKTFQDLHIAQSEKCFPFVSTSKDITHNTFS
jgi:hypothetical protein